MSEEHINYIVSDSPVNSTGPTRSAQKSRRNTDVARETLDQVIDIMDRLEPADARLVAGWLFGRYVGWK